MEVFKRNSPIVFAIVIMPFTAIRFGPIGLGEIIFLLTFVTILVSKHGRLTIPNGLVFSKFWLAFICVSSFGAFYNHLFLGSMTGTISQMLFDLSAYILILLIVFLLETKAHWNPGAFKNLVWRTYIVQFVAFSGLHVLSYFTSSIAGLPLRYYSFFAPLVENLHQTAMLLCTLPFLGLYYMRTRSGIAVKAFCFVSVVWYSIMALETGSTKAAMGLVVGALAVGVHSALYSNGTNRQKLIISFFLIAVFILLLGFNSDELQKLAVSFFIEADPSDIRRFLYFQGLKHSQDSILIGFGPGPHIKYDGDRFWDVHQTFLAVLLQGGLIGILLFLTLLWILARRTFQNPFLFAVFSSAMVYATGGDILRRIPIWILLVFVFYLASENKPSRTSNETI